MSRTGNALDRLAAARRLRWAALATRTGGGLIALGSVLPWAWVPLAGARLPLPGVMGWGALTLLLGVWLYRRAPWWAAGASGIVSIAVAWHVWATLPMAISRAMIDMEWRLQPMNRLLARFGIDPLSLFETATPWAELRGSGTVFVMCGGVLAVAGSVLLAQTLRGAYALRQCAACGNRNAIGRVTAFCVNCGEPMPIERACVTCHTLAEPGDLWCGACGTRLG